MQEAEPMMAEATPMMAEPMMAEETDMMEEEPMSSEPMAGEASQEMAAEPMMAATSAVVEDEAPSFTSQPPPMPTDEHLNQPEIKRTPSKPVNKPPPPPPTKAPASKPASAPPPPPTATSMPQPDATMDSGDEDDHNEELQQQKLAPTHVPPKQSTMKLEPGMEANPAMMMKAAPKKNDIPVFEDSSDDEAAPSAPQPQQAPLAKRASELNQGEH